MPILDDNTPMLQVENLTAGYGRLEILHGVSLTVQPGQPVVVLGANGAGKTTLCRALSGLIRNGGRILLDDADISAQPPHRRVSAGIIQVPEGRQVFPEMTVADNLRLGAFVHGEPAADELRRIYELFPILESRSGQRAGLMSGGEQQMLALGRALMSRPRYLLLDEPSQGLAPKLIDQVGNAIRAIAATGVAILLVEQNLMLAERVAEYAYVMESGRCVSEGPLREILSKGVVQDSYLGST
jgi:branched-chain amino acid transport system ATP-binding protein